MFFCWLYSAYLVYPHCLGHIPVIFFAGLSFETGPPYPLKKKGSERKQRNNEKKEMEEEKNRSN